MFLLRDPLYPDRRFPVAEVGKAWQAAGLGNFHAPTRKAELGSHDIRGLVNAHLMAAGATLTASDSSDFEVPDTAEGLLKGLEAFYLALYPEMRSARPPRNFHYEKVEWLGEF